MKDILSTQRVYVCISIIGCQGVVTAKNSIAGVTASIDRNSLLCEPCVIDNIQSTTELHKSLLRLELDFYMQMAAFSGQQGRNTRPVRAIIGGQQAA
jgi:hypothetical protein